MPRWCEFLPSVSFFKARERSGDCDSGGGRAILKQCIEFVSLFSFGDLCIGCNSF